MKEIKDSVQSKEFGNLDLARVIVSDAIRQFAEKGKCAEGLTGLLGVFEGEQGETATGELMFAYGHAGNVFGLMQESGTVPIIFDRIGLRNELISQTKNFLALSDEKKAEAIKKLTSPSQHK